jgi:hypothetical protein
MRSLEVASKTSNGLLLYIAILLLLLLINLWAFEYLPITDLPEYLLTSRILLENGKPDNPYQGFYEVRPSHTPFAASYFWTIRLLNPVLSVYPATRLYLSVALVATALGLLLWLRAAAPGQEAQSLPATALLYGFYYHIGFLPFLFAVGFFFLAMAAGYRLVADPVWRTRRLFLLAALLVVIYLSHVLTFALAGLMLAIQTLLVARRRFSRIVLAAVPALVLFGLFVLANAQVSRSALQWRYNLPVFRFASLLFPFNAIYDLVTGHWKYEIEFLVIWGGIVACLVAGSLAQRAGRRASTRAYPWRLAIMAAVMLAATLGLPTSVGPGVWIAFHVAYPAAFMLVAAAPADWFEKRVLRGVVLILCLMAPVSEFSRSWVYNRDMRDLARVLEAVPPRQALQPVITDLDRDAFPTSVNMHAAAWYNFQRGGANPYLFALFEYFPVRYAGEPFGPVPGELEASRFRYSAHQKGTDYFLVRSQDTRIHAELAARMPLAARSGRWCLYGPNPGR